MGLAATYLCKRYFGKGSNDGGPKVEEMEHVEPVWSLLTHIYAFDVSDYILCLKALDLDGHEKIVSEAMKRAGRRPVTSLSVEKICFAKMSAKSAISPTYFAKFFFSTPKVEQQWWHV